jgi:hypothetical protein
MRIGIRPRSAETRKRKVTSMTTSVIWPAVNELTKLGAAGIAVNVRVRLGNATGDSSSPDRLM